MGEYVIALGSNRRHGRHGAPVEVVRAALRGDLPTAQNLNFKLLEMYKLLFVEGNPVGVKAAMQHQGLCTREVRLPLVAMSEQGIHLIMAEMEKLD